MYDEKQRAHPLLLLVLLALLAVLPAMRGMAAGNGTAEIPVEVQVTGSNVPTGIPFTFVLTAEQGAPLPASTALTITDAGSGNFGTITFTTPGDYRYTVVQTPGSAANFTYDATVYHVTVRVSNDGEGGLITELWATRNEESEKVLRLLFLNTHRAPTPTPTATPAPTENPAPTPCPTVTPTAAPPRRTPLPQTGDEANLIFCVAVMIGSLGGLTALAVRRQRRRR